MNLLPIISDQNLLLPSISRPSEWEKERERERRRERVSTGVLKLPKADLFGSLLGGLKRASETRIILRSRIFSIFWNFQFFPGFFHHPIPKHFLEIANLAANLLPYSQRDEWLLICGSQPCHTWLSVYNMADKLSWHIFTWWLCTENPSPMLLPTDLRLRASVSSLRDF